ncbi:MAG: methyltransferase domain-containing protein [Thermomicrobiales bacterium]|nr:methyltransferase domain-containing protein [Thermomicrobiales bacterium]
MPPEWPASTLAAGRDRLPAARFLARRDEGEELLDRDDHDPAELAANLDDIRRVNRLAGGSATILCHLPRLVRDVPRGRPVEILDLASGSGDIPLALAAWAARNARPLHLTVTDRSPVILAEAERTLAKALNVTFACCDARAAPMPAGTFDIVLCSLSLHHFAPADAVRVLREMERLSRAGFIVNDIRRCVAGYLAAWAASRVATRNRLTRHDMPLSVRRAYTPGELRALLAEAGIPDATITTHPLFRMAAVRRKAAT